MTNRIQGFSRGIVPGTAQAFDENGAITIPEPKRAYPCPEVILGQGTEPQTDQPFLPSAAITDEQRVDYLMRHGLSPFAFAKPYIDKMIQEGK